MQETLSKNNVTKETVLGSHLMNNLLSDLSSQDIIDRKTAMKFILSLFHELNVPISKKVTKEVIDIYFPHVITKESLRALIIRAIPPS